MSKLILVLVFTLTTLTSFSNKKTMTYSCGNQTYHYYDNCNQVLTVTVSCSSWWGCDCAAMRAAGDATRDQWTGPNGCFTPPHEP